MSQLSGQITVTTAGTAVQGPDIAADKVALAAHPGNTGIVYVGNDGAGDVAATTGFPLLSSATLTGSFVVIELARYGVKNLNALWFDAAVNGNKVCWLIVG